MVIRKGLIIGAGFLLLATVILGTFIAWWTWRNLEAELLLRDQQAKVIVPNPMKVGIDILNDLDIFLDTKIHTKVPIDQTLTLPIRNTLKVRVGFDNTVPIKMNVPIHNTIHLDQKVPVDGKVRAKILGMWLTLPIKGELPVKADIPININVPVDQKVHLAFTAPARVKLLSDLKVPLKTTITTTIPLKSAMKVPVRSRLDAQARILKPADALIAQMNLRLPIRKIGLSFRKSPNKPDTEKDKSGDEK